MLKRLALWATIIVALLHLVFMVLEATQWSTELGQSLTHLSASVAGESAGVGFNMGLYNGFLAFALFWSTFALRERETYSAQWVLLTFIVIAGVVGAITMKNVGIFLLQSLPALVALGLIWLARPYAKTEDDAVRQIVEIERQILAIKTVEPDTIPETARGAVPRGQHPKLLGLLEAKFIVADNLPTELRLGVFKEPGRSYDAWIRFSNARNLDDRDPGGHGMAIKLLNVSAGAGAPDTTQDFVLFDAPVFFVGNPLQYVVFEEASLRALGRSASGTKLTVLLNYYWRHWKQLGNLTKAQRSDVIDPLALRYWSITPYRLGEATVKYSALPVGACATAVTVERSKDMLRQAINVHLDRNDVEFLEFEFQVQTQTDPVAMPIEDPTRLWDETISPFVTVGRLRIPTRQAFDTTERDRFAENLSFTPWHALPEHEPLGGINRVRRAVYESLSDFRHALNRVPREEPGGKS